MTIICQCCALICIYLRVCHSGFAEKSSNQIAGKIKHYKTEELFTKLNS